MAIITAWVVVYMYLMAAAIATFFTAKPQQGLPPLAVSISLLAIFTLVGAVFVVMGLIDPSVMQVSEEELLAMCPLKTWRIRWHEVNQVGVAWLLPIMARGQDGYGFRYPLFVRVMGRGLPPILLLLSLCASGKDSGLESELMYRVSIRLSVGRH